jgi:hypothetical protein
MVSSTLSFSLNGFPISLPGKITVPIMGIKSLDNFFELPIRIKCFWGDDSLADTIRKHSESITNILSSKELGDVSLLKKYCIFIPFFQGF